MNPSLETFIGCDCPYEEAQAVIFGAPFDSTTSFRPGTRFGAKAMRGDSFGIETYSPYQDLDLEDYNVCDLGDLELPFGCLFGNELGYHGGAACWPVCRRKGRIITRCSCRIPRRRS